VIQVVPGQAADEVAGGPAFPAARAACRQLAAGGCLERGKDGLAQRRQRFGRVCGQAFGRLAAQALEVGLGRFVQMVEDLFQLPPAAARPFAQRLPAG